MRFDVHFGFPFFAGRIAHVKLGAMALQIFFDKCHRQLRLIFLATGAKKRSLDLMSPGSVHISNSGFGRFLGSTAAESALSEETRQIATARRVRDDRLRGGMRIRSYRLVKVMGALGWPYCTAVAVGLRRAFATNGRFGIQGAQREDWKPLKLLIQPGDGVERLLKGIKKAKKSIEIVIFRFDRDEITRELVDAVEPGVFVHALIAFTNRGGEENLRKLEMRLLERGITVARTAGDLVRYHGKMMVVDRKELYVLAFNLTHLDIDHSRSFGIITRNTKLVKEAGRLFDADTKRQEFTPEHAKFVVSPANSRSVLSAYIKSAKKELLIYDPKVSDRNSVASARRAPEGGRWNPDHRARGWTLFSRAISAACDCMRASLSGTAPIFF